MVVTDDTTGRQRADEAIQELRKKLKADHPDLARCWDVNMFVMVCKEHKEVVRSPKDGYDSLREHMKNFHPGFAFKPNEPREFATKAQGLMDALVEQWNPMACVVGPTEGYRCGKCDGTFVEWKKHGKSKKKPCDNKVREKIPFYKIDCDGTGKAVKDVGTLGDGAKTAASAASSNDAAVEGVDVPNRRFAAAGSGLHDRSAAPGPPREGEDDGEKEEEKDGELWTGNFGARIEQNDETSALERESDELLKKDLAKGIKVSDIVVKGKFKQMLKQEVVYEVKQHTIEQKSWYRRNPHMLAPRAPPDDFRACSEAHDVILEIRRRLREQESLGPSGRSARVRKRKSDAPAAGRKELPPKKKKKLKSAQAKPKAAAPYFQGPFENGSCIWQIEHNPFPELNGGARNVETFLPRKAGSDAGAAAAEAPTKGGPPSMKRAAHDAKPKSSEGSDAATDRGASRPAQKREASGRAKRPQVKCPFTNVPKIISDEVMRSEPMKEEFFNTKRLYNNGVKYGSIPDDCFVLDVRDEAACRVKLNVTLPEADPKLDRPVPETTEIIVIDARSDTRCIEDLTELSDIVQHTKGNNNCRQKEKVDGKMTVLGWSKIEKKEMFKPTRRICVRQSLKRVTREMACQMRLVCPEMWSTFSEYNIPGKDPLMGGAFGAGQQMVCSENLGNAAHIDVNDKSRTYAKWTKNRYCPKVKMWYLLFPNLSYKGSHGVAIKLFHGAAVSWDGRLVRHCTTIATTLDGTRVRDLPRTEDGGRARLNGFGFVAIGKTKNVNAV
jgi:hypothetical protein